MMRRFVVTFCFSLLATVACGDDKVSSSVSAADKDAESKLDVLKDYDRDLWDGPDGWAEEQWQWKRTLLWSSDCDYVGEVTAHPVSDDLQLVQVMCVPGSYQGKYYLYLFNPHKQSGTKLELGLTGSSENQYDVWGNITFNNENKHVEILTLSRGTGDCGVYRVFEPDAQHQELRLIEKRQKKCSDSPLPAHPDASIFDYKKWPLTN